MIRFADIRKSSLYVMITKFSTNSMVILALHFSFFLILSSFLSLCGVEQEKLSNGLVLNSRYWWLYSAVGIVGPILIVVIYGLVCKKVKTFIAAVPE